MIRRIEQSEQYGMGFRTSEFLASAIVDMEVHMLTEIPANFDVVAFEHQIREKYNMLPQIPLRHRTPVFRHTFSGGYNSGYYMYLWAEQLDSDAFEAFVEAGNIFDQELARKLRYEIFARGGIENAMTLYKNFRGREPDVQALLRNRGLR
jgi:peptidyl-dipeptidase Dcp